MISYKKLFDLFKQHGYTRYRIRKEHIMGEATYTALINGSGGLDSKTINRLCQLLKCQPGDIMEYVEDE